jgi:hypothetical protein
MNPLIPPSAAAAPIAQPDPRDRWSWFTWFWAAWFTSMLAVEAVAIWQDSRHPDKVKRTLSSNTRRATGWDSITGQPLDVPLGRLRRAGFVMFMAWFGEHIRRNGGTSELRV